MGMKKTKEFLAGGGLALPSSLALGMGWDGGFQTMGKKGKGVKIIPMEEGIPG